MNKYGDYDDNIVYETETLISMLDCIKFIVNVNRMDFPDSETRMRILRCFRPRREQRSGGFDMEDDSG